MQRSRQLVGRGVDSALIQQNPQAIGRLRVVGRGLWLPLHCHGCSDRAASRGSNRALSVPLGNGLGTGGLYEVHSVHFWPHGQQQEQQPCALGDLTGLFMVQGATSESATFVIPA